MRLHRLLALIVVFAVSPAHGETAAPEIVLPKHRLEARELGVIVNDRDPLSREIANYYQSRRNIPPENLIHVSFEPGRTHLGVDEFAAVKRRVDAATPSRIQAYVLTWAEPYRVGCMSVTSAFAFGFDRRWCSSERCALTHPSAYFGSDSRAPFTDLRMRPTMALAARDFETAKALIDRGVASDGSRPGGTAYLLSTSNKARNVRAQTFPQIRRIFSPLVKIENLQADKLLDRKDVLFYFTGLIEVEGLDTLVFLPGAVGDHMTSAGGKLTDSKQMSALRWLEAGATGSYGTVVEPCAHPQKFPNPGILMQRYLQGETLIEAYWKSVQMPGEGIFIGEPLAAPFDFREVETRAGGLVLDTWSLRPGRYRLQTAAAVVGPFRYDPAVLNVASPFAKLHLPNRGAAVYRLEPLQPRARGSQPTPTR